MYHPYGVRALSGRCLHIHWWDSVCQVRHSRCIIDQTIHDDLWSRFASSIRVAKVQVRKYKYLEMLSHAIIFWTKKASLCNDVEAKVLRLPKDEWVAQFGQKLTENGSKSQRYKRVINADFAPKMWSTLIVKADHTCSDNRKWLQIPRLETPIRHSVLLGTWEWSCAYVLQGINIILQKNWRIPPL